MSTNYITIEFVMDEMNSDPEYSAEILMMLIDEAGLGHYVQRIVEASE